MNEEKFFNITWAVVILTVCLLTATCESKKMALDCFEKTQRVECFK